MVGHDKHLQLGKLISRTGMYSTSKWHKCVGLWRNLHIHHEEQTKFQEKTCFKTHKHLNHKTSKKSFTKNQEKRNPNINIFTNLYLKS